MERAGGALGVCSHARRPRAFMWIAPAPRAAWALVRRSSFWTAYPAAGVRLIRISNTEGIRHARLRATVVFVDARGRVVGRRHVVGRVAG